MKSSRDATLSDLARRLCRGELDRLPRKLSVQLDRASPADFEALLELVRYQSFGHRVLQKQQSLPGIQGIRAMVHTGRFGDALEALSEAPDLKDPDLLLEMARSLVFSARYAETRVLLTSAVQDQSIPANTRGCLFQVLGHALFEIGHLNEARRCFDQALNLARLSGNVLGRVAALLFVARDNTFQGDLKGAEGALAEVRLMLETMSGSFRWYLGYYRHLSHLRFFGENPRCLDDAYTGALIARSLGDRLFEAKGWIEMILMERRFGQNRLLGDPAIRDLIDSQAGASDLAAWRAAAMENILCNEPSLTLRSLFDRAVKASKATIELPAFSPKTEISWLYDRKGSSLFDLKEGLITKLSPGSRCAALLRSLAEAPSIHMADLFEKAWQLRWSAERHRNLLEVALSRVNKLTPALKVERKDNMISLSSAGRYY